jgi:hypothetical protein
MSKIPTLLLIPTVVIINGDERRDKQEAAIKSRQRLVYTLAFSFFDKEIYANGKHFFTRHFKSYKDDNLRKSLHNLL